MKYKGIELTEFKSKKPVLFDPPKKMLVWDGLSCYPYEKPVDAYIPSHKYPVICQSSIWGHCAEIPEDAKPSGSQLGTGRPRKIIVSVRGRSTYITRA